jgi:hypothetical protein
MPLLGHHRLAKLAPQHVRAFIKRRLGDGLNPNRPGSAKEPLERPLSQ